ncbi:Protein of unknown function [Belliella buryatensis]|uniref:Tll0287-like domain-containing protein n=1 Tax=Belliella buryatensis TaxID=1500549 RepID=A0A239FRZ9_9BACT|nr:DUF3365 domain-containing protein [Belliella buryatensis]SNS58963.1 Protein of unknown function [Belliella buryatensis]
MKKIFYLLLFSTTVWACNSNERISKEVFDDVNRSMEVKKLSESQIIEEAMNWGEEISSEAQTQLIGALQNAIAENGVQEAIRFCHVEALPILSEVSEKYNVAIRRASSDYRNPEDQVRDYEEVILDAYAYNAENGIKNEPNIQKLDNGDVLLFTKAIQIPNSLCLNCHGEPGKDITDETLKVINELYPEDKAKGHKIGDLRGMWSIRLPRAEVIKRL